MIAAPTIVRPVRLQLSRRKGFNLQALSLATNGLPAVNVSRRGKWGNPYPVGEELESIPFIDVDYPTRHRRTAQQAVECFAEALPYRKDLDVRELRGFNLGCWCKLGAKWCHGNVLLELANPIICEGV